MTLDPQSVAFGLDTFGDITVDAQGQTVHPAQVIRNIVAQGQLADSVGIDFFGVGEHHRDDFAVSAPDVVLAGLATTLFFGVGTEAATCDDVPRGKCES